MIDTIYVVSGNESCDDLLEGFATNEAEVARILHNWWITKMYALPDEFTVEVDLRRGHAIVTEGDETTVYFIKVLKRAKIPK